MAFVIALSLTALFGALLVVSVLFYIASVVDEEREPAARLCLRLGLRTDQLTKAGSVVAVVAFTLLFVRVLYEGEYARMMFKHALQTSLSGGGDTGANNSSNNNSAAATSYNKPINCTYPASIE